VGIVIIALIVICRHDIAEKLFISG